MKWYCRKHNTHGKVSITEKERSYRYKGDCDISVYADINMLEGV